MCLIFHTPASCLLYLLGAVHYEHLHGIRSLAKESNRVLETQVKEIMKHYCNKERVPNIEPRTWVPKNPELKIPVHKDVHLTEMQWKQSNFPKFDIPLEITTNVDVDMWKAKILEMATHKSQSLHILNEVLTNLEKGCDSEVRFPGTQPTVSQNHFPDPDIDIPRIADAIASKIRQDTW